ncbi:hypothetical protein AVEN_112864-1 [Araneus ventricosus]|uniref:Uncharacterized protein n=1 Tax=Araneus ventricosus TaxID=182803 RepID=A0A4Y2HTM6_ARAVE|nr:hypothetical protein AVEN_112864-1 [Araneus ventricosus]
MEKGKLSVRRSVVCSSREGESPDLNVQQLTARVGQDKELSVYAVLRCGSIVDSPISERLFCLTSSVNNSPSSSSLFNSANKRTCYFKLGDWYYFKTITLIYTT